jgi:hypothetical protein
MQIEVSDNTVQYQVTREEAVAQLWRLFLLPKLIFSMVFVFLGGIGILVFGLDRPLWAFGLVCFPILFFVFYRRVVHKVVLQHPGLLETQTLSFDERGISISNSLTRVQWPWTRVRSVADHKDFYLFRFDTSSRRPQACAKRATGGADSQTRQHQHCLTVRCRETPLRRPFEPRGSS